MFPVFALDSQALKTLAIMQGLSLQSLITFLSFEIEIKHERSVIFL